MHRRNGKHLHSFSLDHLNVVFPICNLIRIPIHGSVGYVESHIQDATYVSGIWIRDIMRKWPKEGGNPRTPNDLSIISGIGSMRYVLNQTHMVHKNIFCSRWIVPGQNIPIVMSLEHWTMWVSRQRTNKIECKGKNLKNAEVHSVMKVARGLL